MTMSIILGSVKYLTIREPGQEANIVRPTYIRSRSMRENLERESSQVHI